MKVVCIDTDWSRITGNKLMTISGEVIELEFGKVYEASFVMYDDETGKPLEWNKNLLNLEGFSELDWFPTKNFVTLDVWRQKMLDEILSTQKQLHVIPTSEIREDKLNDLGI